MELVRAAVILLRRVEAIVFLLALDELRFRETTAVATHKTRRYSFTQAQVLAHL